MVRVVRDGVVDLAHQKVLAVIQSGRVVRCHARHFTDYFLDLGLHVFGGYEVFCVSPII